LKVLIRTLKYVLFLAVGFGLLWYVYKGQGPEVLDSLKGANYFYVVISMVLGIVGLFARSYRWNLLLEPLGYSHLSIYRTFLAVMSGYFMNIFIPRAGELTRCAVMKRLSDVNFSGAIATVVVERILDLSILLLVLLAAVMIQTDTILMLINQIAIPGWRLTDSGFYLLIAIIVLIVLSIGWFILRGRQYLKRFSWYQKFRNFLREFVTGLLTLRKVKSPAGFVISTIVLWVTYYFMAVVIFDSFQETSHLGLEAGISVLVAGGIGMAVPVQGGIGAYHLLVSTALKMFEVPETAGKSYAALVHSSQLVYFLIFGAVALIVSFIIPVKKAANDDDSSG